MAQLDEPAALDLSVVVPYYNTGPRVRATVDELIATLDGYGCTFEVICVSDGSTDGSDDSLEGLDPAVVRRVRLPANQGKGQALRTGFALGRGRYVGFIDGDGDLPPPQLKILADAAFARDPGPAIVLGSKRLPGSEVVLPPVRRMSSWAWQMLVRALFSLQVADTQCGVKLVRRDVLAAVLPRTVERRFAFDLELLVVARHLGYHSVVEVPVTIRERAGSTVSWRAAALMLADLVAVGLRLRVTRAYDRTR